METDKDIEAFQSLAAKLGHRLHAGDPALDELLRIYGEPLQRVLRNATAQADRAKRPPLLPGVK